MKGSQIIWSGAAIIIAYGLYAYGKRYAKDSDIGIGGRHDDGIDHAWKDDPILKKAQGGDVPVNQSYPACQVWNDDLQVFLDTGLTGSQLTPDVCWQNDDSLNPRFVTSATSVTYKRQDPFAESPAQAGTCLFLSPNGSGSYSFPDYGQLSPGVPMTPVNRSARLCFAAGATTETAGYEFDVKTPFLRILQPGTTIGSYDNVSGFPMAIAPATRCEMLMTKTVGNAGDVNTFKYWSSENAAVVTSTDAQDCLSRTTSTNPTRWRDATDGTFFFTNPVTQKMVQIHADVY